MVFLLDIAEVPEVCQLSKTYFTLSLMYHNQSHTGKTLLMCFTRCSLLMGSTKRSVQFLSFCRLLLIFDLSGTFFLDTCLEWWQCDIKWQAKWIPPCPSKLVWWSQPGSLLQPHDATVGQSVSRIYSTTLLILLQHSVLQYFLLYIEQRLYGPLWVPLVLYSSLAMIS